jgi:hypothetical protein
LEVVGTGENSLRLQLAQDSDTDPPVVGRPTSRPDYIRGRGSVITGMKSRNAYFIPRPPTHSPSNVAYPATELGHLIKVDLTADPPHIIGRSEHPHADLRGIAAACEPADKLFVVRHTWSDPWRQEPSRWVKVFRTSDLTFDREIELPLRGCHRLAVSHDAQYLYAMDYDAARLAVIDVATLQVNRVLEGVLGKRPYLMFPLRS